MAIDPETVKAEVKKRERRDWMKFLIALIGLCLSAGVLVGIVVLSWTNNSQRDQLNAFSAASQCRSQAAADADAAAYKSTVVLLNAIVALGNRQSLDFAEIAATAKALDAAAQARVASVEGCN